MNRVAAQRLADAWRQCLRHAHHMDHALAAVRPMLPLTSATVGALDDESVQDWDQFVLRFTQLQDAIGNRLFSALLDYLLEPAAEQPMIDKINRLEKLGFIEHAEDWHLLWAIRNRFTHDYPDDDALRAAALNEAVDSVELLKAVLDLVQPTAERALAELSQGASGDACCPLRLVCPFGQHGPIDTGQSWSVTRAELASEGGREAGAQRAEVEFAQGFEAGFEAPLILAGQPVTCGSLKFSQALGPAWPAAGLSAGYDQRPAGLPARCFDDQPDGRLGRKAGLALIVQSDGHLACEGFDVRLVEVCIGHGQQGMFTSQGHQPNAVGNRILSIDQIGRLDTVRDPEGSAVGVNDNLRNLRGVDALSADQFDEGFDRRMDVTAGGMELCVGLGDRKPRSFGEHTLPLKKRRMIDQIKGATESRLGEYCRDHGSTGMPPRVAVAVVQVERCCGVGIRKGCGRRCGGFAGQPDCGGPGTVDRPQRSGNRARRGGQHRRGEIQNRLARIVPRCVRKCVVLRQSCQILECTRHFEYRKQATRRAPPTLTGGGCSIEHFGIADGHLG